MKKRLNNGEQLHITDAHTGKMEGMKSISTSCKGCDFCQKMHKIEGTVCSGCYAHAQLSYRVTMQKPLELNKQILANRLLEEDELPKVNANYFRFEAFGELQSVKQAQNYLKIAKANPDTHCAIWTKRPDILNKAIEIEGKPANLQCIQSSIFFNKVDEPAYAWVDKVFTVYSKDYADKHSVRIGCGSRKCIDCLKCYKGTGEKFVNELEK